MDYITRELVMPKDKNILLFGARNTGKSTLIKHSFPKEKCFWIDLLLYEQEDKYRRNPDILAEEVMALPSSVSHIVIDEVQKLPKLLSIVHYLIETTNKKFVLTGSSARKLKSANVNLLAGRAFVYDLYPLSFSELGNQFDLSEYLQWGGLPSIHDRYSTDEDRKSFLKSYTNTYMREEILYEQFIHKIEPFQKFLEVAAQTNGEIVNYSNLAYDAGIDDKTAKNYFALLEETLVGFYLEAYDKSIRKRIIQKAKFYFFDLGVARAIKRHLGIPLLEHTSEFGKAFEHFVVTEILKRSSYIQNDFEFSYLRTRDGAEIDLVVERPGDRLLFIEIKSGTDTKAEKLNNLRKLAKEHNAEAVCLSREKIARKIDDVWIYPWREGIQKYF